MASTAPNQIVGQNDFNLSSAESTIRAAINLQYGLLAAELLTPRPAAVPGFVERFPHLRRRV